MARRCTARGAAMDCPRGSTAWRTANCARGARHRRGGGIRPVLRAARTAGVLAGSGGGPSSRPGALSYEHGIWLGVVAYRVSAPGASLLTALLQAGPAWRGQRGMVAGDGSRGRLPALGWGCGVALLPLRATVLTWAYACCDPRVVSEKQRQRLPRAPPLYLFPTPADHCLRTLTLPLLSTHGAQALPGTSSNTRAEPRACISRQDDAAKSLAQVMRELGAGRGDGTAGDGRCSERAAAAVLGRGRTQRPDNVPGRASGKLLLHCWRRRRLGLAANVSHLCVACPDMLLHMCPFLCPYMFPYMCP
jgi:hypothetical protein